MKELFLVTLLICPENTDRCMKQEFQAEHKVCIGQTTGKVPIDGEWVNAKIEVKCRK